MTVRLVVYFTLIFIGACNHKPASYHDGIYTYLQHVHGKIKEHQIEIAGSWFHYRIISQTDNSILEKSKQLCIQRADRIDLPYRGHTVAVDLTKDGNIVFNDCVFEKE